MPHMGSNGSSEVLDSRTQVPAYYQVSDFVVRRDWYGLAAACAAHEITEGDVMRLGPLLSETGLEDLVQLDAQLQMAGIGKAMPLSESPTLDIRRPESLIIIASGMEVRLRLRFLRKYSRRVPRLIEMYRRDIERRLARNVSYRYAVDGATIAQETRALVELLSYRDARSYAERSDSLIRITRRDPQLLVHLLDDGSITVGEARQALERAGIAPLDILRVAAALPDLLADRQVQRSIQSLGLAELAQLQYELPGWFEAVCNGRIRQLLEELRAHAESAFVTRIEQIDCYMALYGNTPFYASVRQDVLRGFVESLTDDELDQLQQSVILTKHVGLPAVQSMPVVEGLILVNALTVIAMLGERFGWCQGFAVGLTSRYIDEYMPRTQQITLLDDRLSVMAGNAAGLRRIHGELYRLSMRHGITADELVAQVPSVRLFAKLLQENMRHAGENDVRQDIVGLTYVVPALGDNTLRSQVFAAMDEAVFARLLNESIAGSSLALGFFRSCSRDEVLRLLLRWGNAARNGYMLKLLYDANKELYGRLIRELASHGLVAMPLENIDRVLKVLAKKKTHGGAAPEKSITFIDTLVCEYGEELTAQLVERLGINRTEELENVSPFYMRLLIDSLSVGGDEILAEYLFGLHAEKLAMTYDEALALRDRYRHRTVDVASAVIKSMQRAVLQSSEATSQAIPAY